MPNVNMDWLQLVRSHEPLEQIHKYLEKNVSNLHKGGGLEVWAYFR